MKEKTDDDIFQEGMRSYNKKGKYSNPYPPGSHEWNTFERGCTQALKRSSETQYERSRPNREKIYRNTESSSIEEDKEQKRKEFKDSYLRRKGR